MAEFHVEFPEPLTSYVNSQVAHGRYPSVSDYLSHLVQADQCEQQLMDQLKGNADLSLELDRGLASGAGRPWTPAVLNELRSQVIDRSQRS